MVLKLTKIPGVGLLMGRLRLQIKTHTAEFAACLFCLVRGEKLLFCHLLTKIGIIYLLAGAREVVKQVIKPAG